MALPLLALAPYAVGEWSYSPLAVSVKCGLTSPDFPESRIFGSDFQTPFPDPWAGSGFHYHESILKSCENPIGRHLAGSPESEKGNRPVNADYLMAGTGKEARKIAVRRRAGGMPGFVWLGGYRSDMAGTKAEALDRWCAEKGLACCRHDYSGHGESGGRFRDGTISRWTEESLAVFDAFTDGPQILVGSSMGAWIALLMARELKRRGETKRLAAMLLIAPAPDFTHELMWPQLSDAQKREIVEKGFLEEASQYSDEPNIYTKALFDDGKKNLVMTAPIDLGCPVHIVQGMKDPDVPYAHAMKLAECLPSENVTVTLVKDGDHRLSREQDIALLLRIAGDLSGTA